MAPGVVELQAQRDVMAACLRAKGVSVGARPSDDALEEASGAVAPETYPALEIDRVPG